MGVRDLVARFLRKGDIEPSCSEVWAVVCLKGWLVDG